MVLLAGEEAERVVRGGRNNHAGVGRILLGRDFIVDPQGDIAKVLASLEIMEGGSLQRVAAYYQCLAVRTQELVAQRQPTIAAVAQALVARGTLTEQDVREIMAPVAAKR